MTRKALHGPVLLVVPYLSGYKFSLQLCAKINQFFEHQLGLQRVTKDRFFLCMTVQSVRETNRRQKINFRSPYANED